MTIGSLLCSVGLHKRIVLSVTERGDHGDRVAAIGCARPGCLWARVEVV